MFVCYVCFSRLVEAVLELIGLVGRVDVDEDEAGFSSRKLGQVPYDGSNFQMLIMLKRIIIKKCNLHEGLLDEYLVGMV